MILVFKDSLLVLVDDAIDCTINFEQRTFTRENNKGRRLVGVLAKDDSNA
jgi:hypothetical protein